MPPPGGITAGHGAIPVTRVDELLETVSLCRDSFRERGLSDAWVRTCAIVAQPGVEFGDAVVHEYDRANAEPLCRAAREVPGIVLEAHSTDYQRPDSLRRLVEDGVGVLKVGPALTFALRECLFGLEWIERELLGGRADVRLSELAEALERAMLEDPTHWASYYGAAMTSSAAPVGSASPIGAVTTGAPRWSMRQSSSCSRTSRRRQFRSRS